MYFCFLLSLGLCRYIHRAGRNWLGAVLLYITMSSINLIGCVHFIFTLPDKHSRWDTNILTIQCARNNRSKNECRFTENPERWNTCKGSLSHFLILAQIIGTVPSFSKLNSLLTQSQLPSRLSGSEAALGSVEMCLQMLGSAAGIGRWKEYIGSR